MKDASSYMIERDASSLIIKKKGFAPCKYMNLMITGRFI